MQSHSHDTVVQDANRLVADLVTSFVLDPARMASLSEEFRSEYLEPDAFDLTEFLIQKRLLTAYQAEQALGGNTTRLQFGPYVLLEPISYGDFGTVYKARQRSNGRDYAVRVLPAGNWSLPNADPVSAVVSNRPPRPIVLPVTDVESTPSGVDYLAWPFVDGETLQHSVERVGPLTPTDACRIFAELADGLASCHQRGVVHGRVRPANVLLASDRRPCLTDLGLAALLGTVTPDTLDEGRRADIHALGRTLHFALTSLVPSSEHAVLPPVRSRNTAVPADLAEITDSLIRSNESTTLIDLNQVAGQLRGILQRLNNPEVVQYTAEETPADKKSAVQVLLERTAIERGSHPTHVVTRESVDFDLPGETPIAAEDWNARDEQGRLRPESPDSKSISPSKSHLSRDVLAPLPNSNRFVEPAAAPNSEKSKTSDPVDSKRVRMPQPIDVRSKLNQSESIPKRPTVVMPDPPLFARESLRKARSLLFWKSASDAILLSVFGPPTVTPGQKIQLLVYANLPDAFAGVSTLCRALHPNSDLLGVGYIERPVEHKSSVGLHLAVANAGVAKSLTEFTWAGQTQPRTYDLFVPWECPPGLTSGVVSAGIDNERVGTIPFHFVVLPRSS
jgi:serine/threonine protein kinase